MKIPRRSNPSPALALLLCAALAAGCSGGSAPAPANSPASGDGAKSYSFTMGTSSSGGTVYAVGAGISKILNETIPGFNSRAVSTGGAVDNVGMMERKEIQISVNASNTNALAYRGELAGMEAQTNLRGIASLYPSVFHVVVTKESGIQSFDDLKGTKGGVGASASATDVYTQHIVGTAGLDYKTAKDFEPVYSDATSSSDQMKDGHIDWANFPLGVPGSAVIDLAMTGKVDILPIEGAFRDKLLADHPYYVPFTIPGGTYSGFDQPIETAACVITLVADESVDEEAVYQITKALWEKIDEARQINKGLEWMSLEHPYEGIGVPLHPGAERYYKEIGVIE